METVATSGTGAVQDQSGWCLVEESISSVVKELLDDRSACMRDENILATVTDDQEQEDVFTAAPHGAVSPRWLKVCQKRPKKAATRTEAQEMLDFTAVQNVNEEKITIAMDSGAAVSALPKMCRRMEDPRTDSVEWPTDRRDRILEGQGSRSNRRAGPRSR